MKKCEYFVEIKKKRLKQLNDLTMNEVTTFVEKCQKKLSLNELIATLNQLLKNMKDNFNFIQQPVPNINSKVFYLK
jgi:hypothetical protein